MCLLYQLRSKNMLNNAREDFFPLFIYNILYHRSKPIFIFLLVHIESVYLLFCSVSVFGVGVYSILACGYTKVFFLSKAA